MVAINIPVKKAFMVENGKKGGEAQLLCMLVHADGVNRIDKPSFLLLMVVNQIVLEALRLNAMQG